VIIKEPPLENDMSYSQCYSLHRCLSKV